MDEALGFGATQMQQEFAMINSSNSRMDLTLQMNFENLFNTFPGIVHTEIGVLMLYTMFQTSPFFATSLVAIGSTIRFGYVGHFIVTDIIILFNVYISTHVWTNYNDKIGRWQIFSKY